MSAAAILGIASSLAPIVGKVGGKIVDGISRNVTHRRNRRNCGMSKSDYRKRGGYNSTVPLCQRTCYKKYGYCKTSADT